MNNIITLTKAASAVVLTLSMAGCIRFDDRAQADGSFEYEKSTLVSNYNSGQFSKDEQRSTYDIQALTEEQNTLGLMGQSVDIRPPNQLMAVLDGILLDPSQEQTIIWFNAFNQEKNMEKKVWTLILEYLADKNSPILFEDSYKLQIRTGVVTREQGYGGYLNRNNVLDEASYFLQLGKAADGRSVSLEVDVQSYKQINDGVVIDDILEGRTKRSIEIRFINSLLQFAYQQQESEALDALDNKPLAIKLGFDDNHQTAWIIESEFMDVWRKLPTLLQLMSFETVQNDKNLGYFLVKFVPQETEYWEQNNLNPIALEKGEYFVQLGELTGGATSITWLDADKNPLTDQQISDLYLSITDNIRGVILENDKQTKPL